MTARDANDVLREEGEAAVRDMHDRARKFDSHDQTDAAATNDPSKTDDAAELDRLARLPPLEYGRARKEAAKRLGAPASLLDTVVKAKRLALGLDKNSDLQGRKLEYEEPEPWPEPVDGAALLDELAATARRFVVLPKGGAEKVALWVVHTYAVAATDFRPRLGIYSPERECGKTTLLDLLSQLVYRPTISANISPAAFFRIIAEYNPTMLIDEVDSFAAEDSDLRNVLNQGHHVTGFVIRTVGDDHEPRVFPCAAPVAYAHIGDLPRGYDTLVSRSIRIKLDRRLRGETIEALAEPRRRNEFKDLRRRIKRFANDHLEQLMQAAPQVPKAMNREADNWLPLLAIADLSGGEWPERARSLVEPSMSEGGGSIREQLLADIRGVFRGEQIQSADLVKALVALEGRPWAEMGTRQKPLTPNRLARMLKPLGIAPGQIGPEKARSRGYRLDDFQEAFDRYLKPLPEDKPSPTPPEGGSQLHIRPECDGMGTSDIFKLHSHAPAVQFEKCEKPNNDGLLGGWAVAKGGTGRREHKPPPYEVLGPAPPIGGKCALCGQGNHVKRVRHGGEEHTWHLACADRLLAAQGLSPHTIRDLASRYVDEADRRRAGPGLDQDALDRALRQRLAECGVSPEFIAAEFERVMQAVFAASSTGAVDAPDAPDASRATLNRRE
jgi:Protein of unknown function (DUF3631)